MSAETGRARERGAEKAARAATAIRNALAIAAVALSLCACGSARGACECDGEPDDDGACVVTEKQLRGSRTTDNAQWESAPWQGEMWVCFAAGMKLKIEHPLGYEPSLVQVYLAFSESEAEIKSAFLASGDLARIVEVTDEYVLIENNTEEYFRIRVVLE
ncbi:MAG: hypothetical protein JXA30_11740 [Deltaproteobacteria bacterium]|nr:hypothetical protein [Deltaproteobacteria bacterium]